MIGQGHHVFHPGGAAPAGLGKGQVHGDREHHHILGQAGDILIEPAGLGVADPGIQGRHHGDHFDLPFIILQGLFPQFVVDEFEIRSLLAHFHFRPNQGHRVAGKSYGTFFHIEIPPLYDQNG